MVSSHRGHLTYCLQDIFAYRAWKWPFPPTIFWL